MELDWLVYFKPLINIEMTKSRLAWYVADQPGNRLINFSGLMFHLKSAAIMS